jgi:hypothetical protein
MPSNDCHTQIFVAWRPTDTSQPEITASYPPELLDFDATNIPAKVTEAMQEAIQCHATQCYIAAAIMVRKTLEELCADQNATGNNLKERIKALGAKVVLPRTFLKGWTTCGSGTTRLISTRGSTTRLARKRSRRRINTASFFSACAV